MMLFIYDYSLLNFKNVPVITTEMYFGFFGLDDHDQTADQSKY